MSSIPRPWTSIYLSSQPSNTRDRLELIEDLTTCYFTITLMLKGKYGATGRTSRYEIQWLSLPGMAYPSVLLRYCLNALRTLCSLLSELVDGMSTDRPIVVEKSPDMSTGEELSLAVPVTGELADQE